MDTSDLESENKRLIVKVKVLESEIQTLQKSLEESRKSIDINATNVPINLYLVGKYNAIVENNTMISISVGGHENYYSLESYGSSRLPFLDARVLIFNIEGNVNTPFILGFEAGRLIEPSYTFRATLSCVNYLEEEILATIQHHTNVSLKVSRDFLKNHHFKSGDEILVRKIQIGTSFYFVPVIQEEMNSIDYEKLYSFLAEKL